MLEDANYRDLVLKSDSYWYLLRIHMRVIPIRTRLFKEGEDLFSFIVAHCETLSEQSVLVVTSKIVALSERRTAPIGTEQDKEALIRKESDRALKTKYVWLTVKDGMLMASAGIDESNANGKLILLPKKSFETARLLRKKLRQKYRIAQLGVLITDSRTVPFRAGVNGVALGYAGFRGVRDYRGTRDLFGRTFRFSRTNIADGLATAAVLVMGEGSEQQPLARIEDAPVAFCESIRKKELFIDIQDDMYRPILSGISDT